MAEKRPICLYNGQLQELDSADSLPGGGLLSEDAFGNIIGGTSAADAMLTNGAAYDNVVIGELAMVDAITVTDSTIVGNEAVHYPAGTNTRITAFGSYTFGGHSTQGTAAIGPDSSAFGASAGKSAKGSKNSIFGSSAFAGGNTQFPGDDNAIFGYHAMDSVTDSTNGAHQNSVFGSLACDQVSGNCDTNSVFGYKAMEFGSNCNNNVIIGANAGARMFSGASNSVIIGPSAGPLTGNNPSNELWINNAQTETPLIKGYFDAHASGPLLEFAGDVTITNTGPNLTLLETDAAVDEGHYDFFVSGGVLRLRAINDAVSIANDVFEVTRTAAVVDQFNIKAAKTLVSGALEATGAVFVNHVAPTYNWVESGYTADNKNWDMVADAGVMYLRAVNDAYTVAGNALTITRSGTSITSVGIGGDIDTSANKVIDMGTWTSTADHIQIYGNGAASGYGLGVESNTLYYRSASNHRFYHGSLANGGASGVAMNLSSTLCDVKSTTLKASGNLQTLGVFTVDSATPQIKLYESDAATDEKYWRFYASAGTFIFDIHNDANTVADTIATIERTGVVVDSIKLHEPLEVVGAGTFSGGIDKLTSATTAVSVAAATAPTSGQVLTATSSTVATWQTPSAGGSFKGCLAYVGTALTSFTSGTVNMSSESYDTDGFHSTVTNTSRLTIPAGVSKVQISASIRTTSAHEGQLYIMKNGVAHSWAGVPSAAESDGGSGQHDAMNIISGVVPVSQNDYFEMYVAFVSAETIEATNSWICIEVKE